jgi:hypothetical protein
MGVTIKSGLAADPGGGKATVGARSVSRFDGWRASVRWL